MPVRRSAAKKQRAGVTGSRKSTIPARNAPAAPMPVHTTYAVPMGSAFAACARKKTRQHPRHRRCRVRQHREPVRILQTHRPLHLQQPGDQKIEPRSHGISSFVHKTKKAPAPHIFKGLTMCGTNASFTRRQICPYLSTGKIKIQTPLPAGSFSNTNSN